MLLHRLMLTLLTLTLLLMPMLMNLLMIVRILFTGGAGLGFFV